MAYVDLNPIRTGLAETPEDSLYTSARERIADLKSAQNIESAAARAVQVEHGAQAGWLAPVELEPLQPEQKKARETPGTRRASNRGCVFMTLPDYLQLLDWTGRQLHPGKAGRMAADAPSILDRLELSSERWLALVSHFGRRRRPSRVTPACRFNAAVTSVASSVAGSPHTTQI